MHTTNIIRQVGKKTETEKHFIFKNYFSHFLRFNFFVFCVAVAYVYHSQYVFSYILIIKFSNYNILFYITISMHLNSKTFFDMYNMHHSISVKILRKLSRYRSFRHKMLIFYFAHHNRTASISLLRGLCSTRP